VLADNAYEDYVAKGWVTEDENVIIAEWHKSLEEYRSPLDNDANHYAILSDQKWINLVEDGRKSKLLLESLLDDEEKKFLERIDYTQNP
jgi:hypothetical protein